MSFVLKTEIALRAPFTEKSPKGAWTHYSRQAKSVPKTPEGAARLDRGARPAPPDADTWLRFAVLHLGENLRIFSVSVLRNQTSDWIETWGKGLSCR